MTALDKEKSLEHSLDTFLRPKHWDNYIGQETVKKNLNTLIQAALGRGQMPEHILLHGPAGLGKTTLAHIIGSVLRVPLQTVSAVTIERSGDIVSLVSALETGGVLFIDEIHRLNKNIEEVLYPIMEGGSVSVMVGKGPTARSIDIQFAPIVVIAATTQIGKLSAPLRSRFSGGVFRLEEYTEEDLEEIVLQSGKLLEVEIGEDSARAIAQRSRSTPRIANYLLKRVRDYTQIHEQAITPESIHKALRERDIDAYGLTSEDRRLLRTILNAFNGGPVGIQALSSILSEDVQTIEEVYEPFLTQIGFLKRTPRGRSITQKGVDYLSVTEE